MPKYFVHPDITSAETISKDVYLREDVFAEIKEKVFASSWQFVTHDAEVDGPGRVYPFSFLDPFLPEPLLLSRDSDGQLHCLSNVCTHRGNLIAEEACTLQRLQCRYHGRRFSLDGQFTFMPEFGKVKNFPSPNDDLASLPVFQWGPWIFTSLAQDRHPDIYFKDMIERMSWLPLNDFKFRQDLSNEYMVEANWALYCENYLEGFHIPFVHAGLNAVIDYGSYTTELFSYSNLQLGLAREDEVAFDLPTSSKDFGQRIGGYYFWIYPNMMFNFYPWGLSINIVKPVHISKTVVRFLTYVMDESKLGKGAGADLFRVEMEDEEVVQAVQKGIRSRYYAHGRYAPDREQGTHHFHRLLADALG